MKRLKLEELPNILTPEIIDILAKMSDEVPQSEEWISIFAVLPIEDYRAVMDRKWDLQEEMEIKRRTSLSDEERSKEDDARQRMIDNPFEFYGNIGQPETRSQYEQKSAAYKKWKDEKSNRKNK